MVYKGNYRRLMQKELFEQPEATPRTIGLYLNAVKGKFDLGDRGNGKLSSVPVEIDIASQFLYGAAK